VLALILLAFQILPPGAPVRAAELQERAMITRAREHEREARERGQRSQAAIRTEVQSTG